MNKYYAVAIRNCKDQTIKSVQITPSINDFILELRSFLHKSSDSAYTLFPDQWELVYKEVDMADVTSVMSFDNFVVKADM